VPHPTLMKLTTRCGEVAVAGLNEALRAKAVQGKLLHSGRLRADTTVADSRASRERGFVPAAPAAGGRAVSNW
jgi:IS5 family transposase